MDRSLNPTTENRAIPAWPFFPTQVNHKNDGIFDQDNVPGVIEVAIGRLDMYHMPAFQQQPFGLSETALVSQYLDRNHGFRWRQGDFQNRIQRRVLLASWKPPVPFENTFRVFDKGAIEAAFGPANVHDYWNTIMHWFGGTINVDGGQVTNEDFLIGFGGGYGWPTHAYGIGTTWWEDFDTYPDLIGWDPVQQRYTHNFVELDSRVVFVNLYGSYFGHWDCENNFLKAVLANPQGTARHGYGLTAAWHVLGMDASSLTKRVLGKSIGEALFMGQLNLQANLGLMGDPTLRMHNIPPVPVGSATRSSSAVALAWTASPTVSPELPVEGYNVYRAPTDNGPWTLVNGTGLITGTSFTAPRPSGFEDADNFFMIRAVRTEITPAGNYVNMSDGFIVPTQDAPVPLLRILSHPVSQSIVVDGQTAAAAFAVDVVGTKGSGEVTYLWFKNGSQISDGDGSHFKGATTRALLIRGVQLSDAGNYHVVVSNEAGPLASNVATLTTTSP